MGITISDITALMILSIVTIMIFFSILGLLSAFYVKDAFFSALLIFIIFIFVSFNLATLIPIDIPKEGANQFSEFTMKLPIHKIILNTQELITSPSHLGIDNEYPRMYLVISNIINSILFVIVLAISYKKFRK